MNLLTEAAQIFALVFLRLAGLQQVVYDFNRVVRKAIASSLFSLLLLTTLVWGGCISCEQYFMFGGAKSCCSPDGHCKTKHAPANHDSGRECGQIAFDHHKSGDHHIDLPVVAAIQIDLPLRPIDGLERWRGVNPVEASPPDLQILHSTFLI